MYMTHKYKDIPPIKTFVCIHHLTISNAPLITPHNILEYHNSLMALSSGNSTNSANGFSSNINENSSLFGDQLANVGVILRKILNPTYKEGIAI